MPTTGSLWPRRQGARAIRRRSPRAVARASDARIRAWLKKKKLVVRMWTSLDPTEGCPPPSSEMAMSLCNPPPGPLDLSARCCHCATLAHRAPAEVAIAVGFTKKNLKGFGYTCPPQTLLRRLVCTRQTELLVSLSRQHTPQQHSTRRARGWHGARLGCLKRTQFTAPASRPS